MLGVFGDISTMKHQQPLLLILLLLSSAVPSPCLEPCRDVYSDSFACYHAVVRALLASEEIDGSAPSVRMVVIPSFEAEWSVTLHRTGESAGVDLRVASKPLWDEFSDCSDPTRGSNGIEARLYSAALPADLAAEIMKVWRQRLLNLESPQDAWSHGTDGSTYHASGWVDHYGVLCGQCWTPGQGSEEVLIGLADRLRRHAEAPSPETVRNLRKFLHPLDEESSTP